MTDPDEFLICFDCIKERGLRHPNVENLDRGKGRCSFCGRLTLVFREEDFFRADEEIPLE